MGRSDPPVVFGREIPSLILSSSCRNKCSLPIFHILFYADDVLLFINGEARSLHKLMSLLQQYERSSVQLANLCKSSFYVGNRARNRTT